MDPSAASVEATTPASWRMYKYRIYPTKRQIVGLEEQLAFCCDLYNSALEQRRAWWQRRRPWWFRMKEQPPEMLEWLAAQPTMHRQMRDLTELREGGAYPLRMSCHAQREPLKRLDRAFADYFRRCKRGEKPGYPRFRSKRRYDSLTWVIGHGAVLAGDGRLRLGILGSVKVKWHRALPSGATAVTVRRSCGRWYVVFSVPTGWPATSVASEGAVGVDVGVHSFAALSTGQVIRGPKAGRQAKAGRRRGQRRLARRRKGSNRRRKAGGLLVRHYERVRNIRRDHAFKAAHSLVQRFDTIYVEDLQIRNLTRSAKGTLEKPGLNVSAKAGLNREILDQAWGAFLTILCSKAEEAGCTVIAVPPSGTSQTCSECGALVPKTLDARVHRCPECGYTADRDVNAARNILKRGLCGLGRSLQAPTWSSGSCVA